MANRARVVFTWARRPAKGTASALRAAVEHVMAKLGVADCEVGVLICSDQRIRALNQAYRGRDQATDVLSFPSGEVQPDGPRYLGDIAISLDTARHQAAAAGIDERQELVTLLVHGLLHLLGWDHERDGGEMARLEEQLRGELGL